MFHVKHNALRKTHDALRLSIVETCKPSVRCTTCTRAAQRNETNEQRELAMSDKLFAAFMWVAMIGGVIALAAVQQ